MFPAALGGTLSTSVCLFVDPAYFKRFSHPTPAQVHKAGTQALEHARQVLCVSLSLISSPVTVILISLAEVSHVEEISCTRP